tara:strand:+ start:518 stop:850 length:333 start_codon:yes stop_codon:yes gene_type:complete
VFLHLINPEFISGENAIVDVLRALDAPGKRVSHNTFLVKAIKCRMFKIVNYILNCGVTPNGRTESGESTLMILAESGKFEIYDRVRKMLPHGSPYGEHYSVEHEGTSLQG